MQQYASFSRIKPITFSKFGEGHISRRPSPTFQNIDTRLCGHRPSSFSPDCTPLRRVTGIEAIFQEVT